VRIDPRGLSARAVEINSDSPGENTTLIQILAGAGETDEAVAAACKRRTPTHVRALRTRSPIRAMLFLSRAAAR
jgi:hypothetical protein